MKLAPIAVLSAVLLSTAVSLAEEVSHPRLFLTEKKVQSLRKAIEVKGSHHQRAYAALKARVDGHIAEKDMYGGSKYWPSYVAREAALLSVIGPEKDRKKYATLACDVWRYVYGKGHKVSPVRGSGLAKGMMSLGLGLSYDWCYNTWTDEQREYVQKKVDEALKAWPGARHPNVSGKMVSNWAAVMRGGEMVLRLAAGADTDDKRYKKIRYDLMMHSINAFGSLGMTQEGLGYTEYPGGFLMPAAYAAAQLGDAGVLGVLRSKQSWRLAMYSHSFMDHPTRKFLMSGVSHQSNYDEGWASLLLNLPAEDQMPYYLWFYDRHMGVKGPHADEEMFDANRAGTVWSLLYYPVEVKPKDPTGVFPQAVGDKRGYYFFRNRWKDANDIQLSLMADSVHHRRAWDQPEIFAINILAHDTRFIGGPGKKRDQELYSTLLIDGKYSTRATGNAGGKTKDFTVTENGGYVIVDGSEHYGKLGCTSAERHGLVHFTAPEKNTAVFATLDRVKADESRTFTWQANLGNESEDGGVKLSSGSEAGRPFFLMKGKGDAYVKGWVLSHPDATITAKGDPLRIDVKGSKADLWVVMYIGSGTPPKATITGSGLGST
ncbi:MAG: hypothetical protein ACLFVU_12615, partial [Phycisphaerae bacterium]